MMQNKLLFSHKYVVRKIMLRDNLLAKRGKVFFFIILFPPPQRLSYVTLLRYHHYTCPKLVPLNVDKNFPNQWEMLARIGLPIFEYLPPLVNYFWNLCCENVSSLVPQRHALVSCHGNLLVKPCNFHVLSKKKALPPMLGWVAHRMSGRGA
jgi:hypothetical protein